MTESELAVLSLVTETPRHGYAIEETIEERGMREWTDIGFSSIYYLLAKLEQDGLVAKQPSQTSLGPARSVYAPTAKGRRALRSAVAEALSTPQPSGSKLLLGLSNLPVLTPADGRQALTGYGQQIATRLADLRRRRGEQAPLPPHVDAMFDYGEALLETELAWVARTVARLEEAP